MIRNILLAGVATFAMVGAAAAADMPVYPAEAPAVVDVPVANTWEGLYLGVHGGWNWGESNASGEGDIDFGDLEGFVIGGQVGYNWQVNNIVFGLEFDGSYVDNDEDGEVGEVFFGGIEQNYLASARGRLGFGFDRFLVYGTGGAAFTGLDFSGATGIDSDDANYFGWVAGAGVEFALTQNITLGVEYLHYDFGDESFDDAFDGLDIDLSNDVVRGRLNVKFDSLFGR
ncbi:outer membrane protein [Terrihabitans sp. B22-R8]|uniref:outer membrane protein n=1 Tax=Terrihabitans sp. B22-R8 TaxID=3425128 RepID=UPI00403D1674